MTSSEYNTAVKNWFGKFCLFDRTELSCFAYNRKFFSSCTWVKHGLICWGLKAELSTDELRKFIICPGKSSKKNAKKTDFSSQ